MRSKRGHRCLEAEVPPERLGAGLRQLPEAHALASVDVDAVQKRCGRQLRLCRGVGRRRLRSGRERRGGRGCRRVNAARGILQNVRVSFPPAGDTSARCAAAKHLRGAASGNRVAGRACACGLAQCHHLPLTHPFPSSPPPQTPSMSAAVMNVRTQPGLSARAPLAAHLHLRTARGFRRACARTAVRHFAPLPCDARIAAMQHATCSIWQSHRRCAAPFTAASNSACSARLAALPVRGAIS